ncbi:MAG: protein translocase subunit SecD [Alphaproteobacteria bacterium]|nr:MAG: protein translocase subunit SecD [Alphaproteobacteria bacterium]
MIRLSKFQLVFVVLVIVWGSLLALPNFLSEATLSRFPAFMPTQRVNLGLDLKGGAQLLLEAEVEKSILDRFEQLGMDIKKNLRKESLGYQSLTVIPQKDASPKIVFVPRIGDDRARVRKAIREASALLQVTGGTDNQLIVTYSDASYTEMVRGIIGRTRDIIHKRIDAYGTSEPTILIQGTDRILVQLPGVSDPARVKELLGTTAKMSFHLVPAQASEGSGYTSATAKTVPLRDEKSDLAIEKQAVLSGENLVNAQPRTSQETGEWEVHFELDGAGAAKFGEITANNIGRRFAIVLDDKIITAPRINGAIPGGSGMITGSFSSESAHDLALLMRSGALPAPIKVIEERLVGPDLGQDSINAGKNATILAVVLVGIFMIVSYAFFGFVANVGLIANLILLVGGLSMLGATLTLPGIAGIALTLGMAVDANVLIFERIREELAMGRKNNQAISAGYDRAMTTIIDSNITTLLAALVLFYYGSGPIQGFAVTLSLGIIISMFTAITFTRVIITLWINWFRPKTLSI